MEYLFGKPKAKSPVVSPKGPPGIAELRDVERKYTEKIAVDEQALADLQRKEEHYAVTLREQKKYAKKDEVTAAMKTTLAAAQRNRAAKLALEKRIADSYAVRDRITAQLDTIIAANLNIQATRALRSGLDATPKLSVDEVEETMDDLILARERAEQITAALAAPTADTADDDLLSEFLRDSDEETQAADDPLRHMAPPVLSAADFPALPTTAAIPSRPLPPGGGSQSFPAHGDLTSRPGPSSQTPRDTQKKLADLFS